MGKEAFPNYVYLVPSHRSEPINHVYSQPGMTMRLSCSVLQSPGQWLPFTSLQWCHTSPVMVSGQRVKISASLRITQICDQWSEDRVFHLQGSQSWVPFITSFHAPTASQSVPLGLSPSSHICHGVIDGLMVRPGVEICT